MWRMTRRVPSGGAVWVHSWRASLLESENVLSQVKQAKEQPSLTILSSERVYWLQDQRDQR